MSKFSERIPLVLVFFSIFLDLLSLSLALPLVPFIVLQNNGSVENIGVILSIYAATQTLATPLVGHLADKLGRAPLIIICILGTSVSMLFCYLADSLVVFSVARGVAGLFGGSAPAVQAYIVDYASNDVAQAKLFGYLQTVGASGFMIGPGIAAIFSHSSYQLPFLVVACLAFAVGAMALVFVRDIPQEKRRVKEVGVDDRASAKAKYGGTTRCNLASCMVLAAVQEMQQYAVFCVIALIYMDGFNWTPFEIGITQTVQTAVTTPIGTWLLQRSLSKKRSIVSIFCFASLVQAVGTIMTVFMGYERSLTAFTGIALVILSNFLWGVGCFMASSSWPGIVAEFSGAQQVGRVMGTAEGLRALVRTVTPPLWTFWYANEGSAIFIGVSCVLMIGFISGIAIYLYLHPPHRLEKSTEL